MLFSQTIIDNLFTTNFSSPKHHATKCLSEIFLSFLCAKQKVPYPLPPHCSCSDWLGVGLELKSFYYLTSTHSGNQRVESGCWVNVWQGLISPLTSLEWTWMNIMYSSLFTGVQSDPWQLDELLIGGMGERVHEYICPGTHGLTHLH